MQFSIQMPDAGTASSWLDRVRRIEAIGCYSVSVPDHFSASMPQLAPLIALASAATVTTQLRLATTVLDNDFRHPVMLAKEIATLDEPEVRVSRLWESIALLDQLLTGDEVTFNGRFYNVEGYRSYPRPAQQPIPLMIGGGGKRMLTLAARRANIISLIVQLTGNADSRRAMFEEQLGWITAAGGRDRNDLRLGVRVFFGAVTGAAESRRAAAERLAPMFRMEPDEVLASPFGMIGSPGEIRDHFIEINERYGITYFTLNEDLALAAGSVIEELSTRT
jgi:alkanesulfonate monooxygenase SsuD/methylene tetrahydromethanopterin reductase-like flavin-dependent oxidoreductase (luciferase family)